MRYRPTIRVTRQRAIEPVGIAAAAFLLLLGAMPGCGNDGDSVLIARGSAFTSPIVDNGVKNTYKMSIRTGVVAIATVETLDSDAEVVLDSITPLRISPGLDLLAVYVNFIYKKGVHGHRGMPGVYCTDRWPPERLVGLYEVPRLRVRPGDRIGVTFFARTPTQGDQELTGVRVRYREGGVLMEQTTESTTLTVIARDSSSDLRPFAECPAHLPSHWLGTAESFFTDENDGRGHDYEHEHG